MALNEIPRFDSGVVLTEFNDNPEDAGTWFVVTDWSHPYGADVVGYPSYGDAYQGWKMTVEAVEENA